MIVQSTTLGLLLPVLQQRESVKWKEEANRMEAGRAAAKQGTQGTIERKGPTTGSRRLRRRFHLPLISSFYAALSVDGEKRHGGMGHLQNLRVTG